MVEVAVEQIRNLNTCTTLVRLPPPEYNSQFFYRLNALPDTQPITRTLIKPGDKTGKTQLNWSTEKQRIQNKLR